MNYRKRQSIFSLSTALHLCLILVPSHPAFASPVMPGVVLRVLPNGLRLLIREQHSTPLVAVDAWVRAGSGREGESESGAAHFLEHLIFKGTATRKPGEIDGAIEDLGATLSAFTLRDAAHFSTTVPSAHTATAIEVLADALRNSIIDPAEVERERSVILDELARATNDTQKDAVNRLYSQLVGEHPFSRPVLGSAESIRRLTRDAIFQFYRRWYGPANTTLVVVGDVTPDRAEDLVKRAFGTWAGATPMPPMDIQQAVDTSALPKPAAKTVVRGTYVGVASSSQFAAVGFLIQSEKPSAVGPAAIAAAALLNVAVRSRLAIPPISNEKRVGPATRATDVDVNGEFTPQAGPSLLAVSARMGAGGAVGFRKAIDVEVERLTSNPPSAQEVDTAVRRVVGAYLYDIETYSGQARALGMYDVVGDYTAAQTLVDQLLALKPDDFSSFARKWLVPDLRADLVLNPPAKP